MPITGKVVSDGHGLVGPRAVYLQADPFPFGARGYKTVGGSVSRRTGFGVATAVTRNTRLRLVSDGVVYPPAKVYAVPPISVKYKATDEDLVVLATLRIGRTKGLRRAGRVGLYRLKDGSTTAERIGVGRTRANGVARFMVAIPPDLTRGDRVVPCLRGGSRRGFGAPNALDRGCGAKTIEVVQAVVGVAAGPEPEHGHRLGDALEALHAGFREGVVLRGVAQGVAQAVRDEDRVGPGARGEAGREVDRLAVVVAEPADGTTPGDAGAHRRQNGVGLGRLGQGHHCRGQRRGVA